jgi:hypothetical protein
MPGAAVDGGKGCGMFPAPGLAAGSTAGDAARPEGERSRASADQGRGGRIDTLDVRVGAATGRACRGGTSVVEPGTGKDSCPAAVVGKLVCWTGADVDGRGAGDWARQASVSNQGTATVARITVNLPIRSIGRGSLPILPDRNRQRCDSGPIGCHMLYRLVPLRALMTNAAIVIFILILED